MGHTGRAGGRPCDAGSYPQLTDQANRKILGQNLAKLHGSGF